MIIDFSRTLIAIDGSVFQEIESGRPTDVTLRTLCSAGLQAVIPKDNMATKEKLVDLLLKIHRDPVQDLSEDEISLLKTRLQYLHCNPLMVVQLKRILEGKPTGLEDLLAVEEDPKDESAENSEPVPEAK